MNATTDLLTSTSETSSDAAVFRGRHVTVMGLGRFGGGAGVTEWLAGHGAEILVTDLAERAGLEPSIRRLQPLIDRGQVRLRLGEHREADFIQADLVVANPAVPKPWQNEMLVCAQDAGTPVTTEIRLLLERLDRERVIGITGTAGKSTTSAMIHHVLTHAGLPAWLGGNIGGSLLLDLERIRHGDWIVLELSSAMLYWLGAGAGHASAPGFSPHVAVLTNLAPNHVDWHGSHAHYARSKEIIFSAQVPGDHQVRGHEVPAAGVLPLRLPGPHNQRNAWVALTAVACATDRPPAELAPLLADFCGLPHRLAQVTQHGEQKFFDDSKSTTPQATVLAVRAFPHPDRVHLIAGGHDKGVDLGPISDLATTIAGLYTIGFTGPGLAAAAGHGAFDCGTLERAVAAARERMGPADVLLLSPGCASWDQFENFEARGRAFAKLVGE